MTEKQKRVIIWCAVSSERQGADDRESIPDQLKRQRDRAAKNGWLIIDEIIVHHSRDYLTYDEFSREAADDGWADPLRMWEHWRKKSFDILSCRDIDRIGREQSIVAEFISRTMQAGAVILPLDSSLVDLQNYRFASAMQGMGAASHIDKLKAGRDIGMRGRAKRGEQISWRVPTFYILDDNKKLVPNRETYQRLFDDIYELFTAGTSYEQMPSALAARGHINARTGTPYNKTVVKRLMVTARTWGHAEFNRTGVKRGKGTLLHETWVTGRGEPPADVFFERDVCEPIWQGEQKEAMIDELERRFYAIRGASRPGSTYAFSQLCVCAGCGRKMVMQRQRGSTRQLSAICHKGRLHKGCPNPHGVHVTKLEDFMTAFIHELLRQPDAAVKYANKQPVSRLAAIDRDVTRLQLRIDNLLEMASTASAASRADYQRKIDAFTDQRDTLKAERIRHELDHREQTHIQQSRLRSLEDVKTVGVLNVWSLPQTTQNQLLRKLLGQLRLLCDGGEVIGLREVENG